MTKRKIILFNGPPRSGKDTACSVLLNNLSNKIKHVSFAEPLKKANQQIFSLPDSTILRLDNDSTVKDKPIPELFNHSWRQININLCEKFLKKEYGNDIMGKLLINKIKSMIIDGESNFFCSSDSGFDCEIPPLIDYFGIENILLVKIHRRGCSYEGDSRQYINIDIFPGIEYREITNNYLFEFEDDILKIVKEWLGV